MIKKYKQKGEDQPQLLLQCKDFTKNSKNDFKIIFFFINEKTSFERRADFTKFGSFGRGVFE